MAQLAAKIDTEVRQLGRAIPFADLLIGATALRFGCAESAPSKCLPTWPSSGSEATPTFPPSSASKAVLAIKGALRRVKKPRAFDRCGAL